MDGRGRQIDGQGATGCEREDSGPERRATRRPSGCEKPPRGMPPSPRWPPRIPPPPSAAAAAPASLPRPPTRAASGTPEQPPANTDPPFLASRADIFPKSSRYRVNIASARRSINIYGRESERSIPMESRRNSKQLRADAPNEISPVTFHAPPIRPMGTIIESR